ncbi:MAG: GIY-YIG nuclease family protein [Anaerolineaceae bacterium]|nr:GIY-YIG nuclease family protein [Anaerolineaceae bacterium]
MSTSRPIFIYRFDSVCGSYCYIGQTTNLVTRIRDHGNATGDSAIYRHCRECGECDKERQTKTSWEKYFKKVDEAISQNQADEHEQRHLNNACEAYIRDHRKPFPLNLRTEYGSSQLQREAFTNHALAKERSRADHLQQERSRLERESDTLKAERVGARQERDNFRKERDTARKQRTSAVRERDRLRKKLAEEETRTGSLQASLESAEQERDDARQERDKFRNERDTARKQRTSAERERNRLRKKLAEEETRTGPLQASLESAERERDDARQERDNFRKERDTARKQRTSAVRERNRLRKQNDALTGQLSELQRGQSASQKRLADLEQQQVTLRNQKDVLTHKFNQVQEQHHASKDRLASVERELGEKNRLLKQYERKARGDARERKRLERKVSIAAEIHKRERRRRNLYITILVVIAALAAGVSFIAFENPDILEQGRELLFSLLQDDSAPATVPFSSRINTATPHPSARPSATRTPRPTVTLRPSAMPTFTSTPFLTATPLPVPAPQQFTVIETLGANARACPRMDCDVQARLARGSQVTVMDEVQGETYRESALWYRIAWQDGPEEAFVHSSLLGPPTPTPADG